MNGKTLSLICTGLLFSFNSMSQELDRKDETTIWLAVLRAAYAGVQDGYVLVSVQTASMSCQSLVKQAIDFGGCSGMRTVNESPEQRIRIVRDHIPKINDDMADDLLNMNQDSSVISSFDAGEIPYVIFSPNAKVEKKHLGSPAFMIVFSRVGFSTKRDKAVLYIGTINWVDKDKSIGQYIYLEKNDGKWEITDHVKIWSL